MASSNELIKKRSEYYAFKEKVNTLKNELKKSITSVSNAASKTNESYSIDSESADNNKLKKIQNDLQDQYNILVTRTLPAIDYKISRLSTEIEQAIANEVARAKK